MYKIRKSINLSLKSVKKLLLKLFSASQSKNSHRTHDYRHLVWGSDYVFELLNTEMLASMTGIGEGIKADDYIILQKDGKSYRYQVQQIDYYSDPPDMWIAVLKEISVDYVPKGRGNRE